MKRFLLKDVDGEKVISFYCEVLNRHVDIHYLFIGK